MLIELCSLPGRVVDRFSDCSAIPLDEICILEDTVETRSVAKSCYKAGRRLYEPRALLGGHTQRICVHTLDTACIAASDASVGAVVFRGHRVDMQTKVTFRHTLRNSDSFRISANKENYTFELQIVESIGATFNKEHPK